ncbi:MAG TPA: hypothetical protein VKZ41_14175 [Gemmatimonadales bacterium]|nr:hypothetical protein [Gemmatimonadales bacterium]
MSSESSLLLARMTANWRVMVQEPRSAGSGVRLRGALLALVAVTMVAGCSDDSVTPLAEPQRIAADQPGEPAMLVRFAQVGAFTDTADAARLRDSLRSAGWQALVRRERRQDSLPPWRVAVEPSPGRFTALVVGASMRATGHPISYGSDSAPPMSVVREVAVARTGDRGQIRTVRWAMSPDREILAAIEDPSGVENEPLPDGLVVASERSSFMVRVDSVWDATISQDWNRLVFGKAYLVTALTPEGITAREWFRIAFYTEIPAGIVRRNTFEASRMNEAQGFGQPVLVRLDSVTPRIGGSFGAAAKKIQFPGGWRVRWTGDGTRLAVATKPDRIDDDAEGSLWMSVAVETGLGRADLPRSVPDAGVKWTRGPMLDVSVALDSSYKSFPIPGGSVESSGGWIRVRGNLTGGETRMVAAGFALAVTKNGRYLLALVADPEAAEHTVPYRLAVLELG